MKKGISCNQGVNGIANDAIPLVCNDLLEVWWRKQFVGIDLMVCVHKIMAVLFVVSIFGIFCNNGLIVFMLLNGKCVVVTLILYDMHIYIYYDDK